MHRRVPNNKQTPLLPAKSSSSSSSSSNNPPQQQQQQQQQGTKRRKKQLLSSSNKISNNSSFVDIFADDPVVGCFMVFIVIVVILIIISLGVVGRLIQMQYDTSSDGSDSGDTKTFSKLQPSKIYTIPHSMSHIGDKSDEYATLRKEYEQSFPFDPNRSLEATNRLLKYKIKAYTNPSYDVYDCPRDPPENYPHQWQTLEILKNWSPNDPNLPPSNTIHQGICVFDYRRDYVKAINYRNREVPFVVRGDPEVAQTVERWNSSPEYLSKLLGDTVYHRVEYSESNQFMYWMLPGKKKKRTLPPGWTKPTSMMRMTYKEWLEKANVTDDSLLQPNQPHWYFRLIGCGETGPRGECDAGSSEYLFDELTFFQPRNNLYMVEPHDQRGIHCRFGMTGVTAENHFDLSRNSIVVLGGSRRYILSHPNQCQNLYLYPKGHPSSRHSQVDWNDPDLKEYPNCK